MNIYVGNLAYGVTEAGLQEVFAKYGTVESANIITDRNTGNSKGFGFVEMPDDADAEKAIKDLDGSAVGGRNIRVNQARPKTDRPRRRQF